MTCRDGLTSWLHWCKICTPWHGVCRPLTPQNGVWVSASHWQPYVSHATNVDKYVYPRARPQYIAWLGSPRTCVTPRCNMYPSWSHHPQWPSPPWSPLRYWCTSINANFLDLCLMLRLWYFRNNSSSNMCILSNAISCPVSPSAISNLGAFPGAIGSILTLAVILKSGLYCLMSFSKPALNLDSHHFFDLTWPKLMISSMIFDIFPLLQTVRSGFACGPMPSAADTPRPIRFLSSSLIVQGTCSSSIRFCTAASISTFLTLLAKITGAFVFTAPILTPTTWASKVGSVLKVFPMNPRRSWEGPPSSSRAADSCARFRRIRLFFERLITSAPPIGNTPSGNCGGGWGAPGSLMGADWSFGTGTSFDPAAGGWPGSSCPSVVGPTAGSSCCSSLQSSPSARPLPSPHRGETACSPALGDCNPSPAPSSRVQGPLTYIVGAPSRSWNSVPPPEHTRPICILVHRQDRTK